MLTNLKRIFNFAFVNFYRNKGISLAAIFVLTATVLFFTFLFFIQGIGNFLIETIENKIDITAYFKAGASEEDILKVREEVLNLSPDIKIVQYASKEDALNEFLQKHQDNPVFSQALAEVGDNPFYPSLNITTSGDPSSYEQVSSILQSDRFGSLIEKVDFSQKKDTIEKIFSVTAKINKFGLALGAFLILVVVIVVFNTIKLVINGSKEEISIMNIVGASSWFVRSPFVIEGGIFGLISFSVGFIITFLSAYFFSTGLASLLPGFNLFRYFVSNLWIIILIQLGAGIGLGSFFSFIAVKRYLSE